MEEPNIEYVGGSKDDIEISLEEQIKAVQMQIDTLESQYRDVDIARITALKSELQKLNEKKEASA